MKRLLAEGGFGSVHLAIQLGLDRPVALKLLHAELLEDAESRARFLDEAVVVSQLSHPHIVRVIDHDVEDGRPWIAYEYLPGRTLEQIAAAGPLPVEDAITAAAQIASALEHAHARGVLHRDVKPPNIIEDAPGHVKVADFGIAKFTGARVETRSGVLVGTPAYIAPERFRGAAASPQTEVFAVGVILFELLTGEHPYGGNLVELMHAVTTGAPRPGRSRAGTPEWLDRVVQRAIDPDPDLRFSSMGQLAAALEAGSASALPRDRTTAVDTALPSLHGTAPRAASSPAARAALGIGLAIALVLAGSRTRPAGSPGTPRTSPAPGAGEGGPRHAALAAAVRDMRASLGRREADHRLVTDGLFELPPRIDALRAESMCRELLRTHRPELRRLEEELGRAAAHAPAPARRSLAEDRELAHGAACACAWAIRLDRLEQLGALAGRVHRGAETDLASLVSVGMAAGELRTTPALLPVVMRALRSCATVLARAARPADLAHVAGVLGDLHWCGEWLRGREFPPATQHALDRAAEALWRETDAATALPAGRRIVQLAEGLFNLGRQSDGRLVRAQRAMVADQLDALEREYPELSPGVASLSRALHQDDTTRKKPPSAR